MPRPRHPPPLAPAIPNTLTSPSPGLWLSLMPALGELSGMLLFVVIVCRSQHLGDTML